MLTGPTKGVTGIAVNPEYIAATCEDFATYIYNSVSVFSSNMWLKSRRNKALESMHIFLKSIFFSAKLSDVTYRASSSYFFLFFSAPISSYFSYFLAILLTISKYLLEINILSLFQVCFVQNALVFFHKIVFIIPEMFVLIINKV